MADSIIGGVLVGLILLFLSWVFKIPIRIETFIRGYFKQKWNDKHAFTFFLDGEYKKAKKLKLPIGISSHALWIKPYKPMELNGFTVRLIPTKSTKRNASQAPSSIIEIEETKIYWESGEKQKYGKEKLLKKEGPFGQDEPSKWRCYFDDKILRTPKLWVGIKIKINAKEKWNGYLSFESHPQRQYGRLRVKIK